MVDDGEIVAVLAVAKIGGGVDVETVLAVAKTEDVAVYMAVRGWEGGVLAVITATAKTGIGDVDIATRGGEIVGILAVAVVTAKTEGLLIKNVAKRGGSGNKDVENNPFWPSLI